MSKEASAMANALKACRSSFSTCRKYEDDIASVIHSCSLNTDAIKAKLKSLTANKNSIEAAQTKLKSLASRRGRIVRSLTTCAGVLDAAKSLVAMLEQNPASTRIKSLADQISAAEVQCTKDEKDELNAVSTMIDEGLEELNAEIEFNQATLLGEYKINLTIPCATLSYILIHNVVT